MATLAGCSGDPSAVALPDAAALDAAGDTAMSDVLDASDAPDAAPSIDVTSDAAPVDDSVQPSPVDSTVAPPRDAAMDATPPPPDVPCTAGLSRCDRDCVDLARSPAHCGRCGGSCAPGQSCVDGRCALVCPVGETVCAGACRDLSRDVTHCGACGAACPSGQSCVGGRCALVCPTGQSACAGACRDFSTDNAHCGACGVSCPAGRRCSEGRCGVTCADGLSVCDEACANTRTNPEHCGACGVVCAIPNAVPRCAEGRCVVGMCNTGFADCDGDPANGCEVDTRSATNHCGGCGRSCPAVADGAPTCVGGACGVRCDPGFTACGGACVNLRESASHCGACGAVCAAGANASALCAEGRCRSECRAGFGDCDGDPANGCEVDLRTSAAHCGACRGACPAPPNGGAVCAAGVCGVRCDAGFSDCDGACVNLQSSPSHCGACARECPAGQGCAAGRCQDRCDAPNLRCASACIDPGVNPSHCGACGNVCPGAANATATCAGGSCGLLCRAGFGDCDGSAGSGCESSLLSDVSHCGACNNICRAGSNSAVACVSGRCQYTCSTGFGDCDANATNGCEVNLLANVSNCGACGQRCTSAPNAAATCSGGRCALRCNAGFGDCDGDASNGCEASLSSATHCGACGVACSGSTPVCSAANGSPGCVSGCVSGFTRCGTICANLQSSLSHCGACGRACAGGANAAATCSLGVCGLACSAGFANCDGDATNGCEVDTRSSTTHCGACGNVCASGSNGTPACVSGACSVTCAVGHGNCDGNATNGCEVDIRGSIAHCGRCGNACSAGANASPACLAGACALACRTGYANCDGSAANGCEVDTRSDTAHCGACGRRCQTGANATATCALGVCGVTCGAGFANCDGDAANGCEADLRLDTAHCGACGRACSIANGSSRCASGACSYTCNAGFHLVGGVCVADGGVRPVQPTSLGDVTQRRPTLRWALPTGADGAVVELCRDRACASVIETLRVTGTSARPVTTLPARSVVFWRARARVGTAEDAPAAVGPTWLFHTPAADAANGVDTSFNAHFDVNGDGFDDVVVGASYADPGDRLNAGTASVFHGSASGVATTPVLVLEGVGPDDGFGGSVSGAGDVNGDGFADLVVGSVRADPGGRLNAGTASVFYGSTGGLAATPGRVLEGVASDDWFGGSVSGAGDVNGDGFADLVVGSLGADPGGRRDAGAARVFLGSAIGVAATPARVFEGVGQNDRFGGSVSGAGDVNGDGFADLVVGALQADPGGRRDAGTASVFHGSPSGVATAPARVLEGVASDDWFGRVSSAGDVNGDGFADLVVGAMQADPSGRFNPGSASVYHGSPDGVAAAPARVLEGAGENNAFGYSVASARDVNGDGFADLVVGSIYANGGNGTASVFHGSASGVAATPARVLVPIATNRFGHSVAGAGDVNSDGFADLIVGALGTAGSASVFHGSASGVAATPARVLVGVDPEDRFGDSVASVPPPKPRWRAAVLPRYDTAQPATPRARRAPGRACATESPRWGRGRRPT